MTIGSKRVVKPSAKAKANAEVSRRKGASKPSAARKRRISNVSASSSDELQPVVKKKKAYIVEKETNVTDLESIDDGGEEQTVDVEAEEEEEEGEVSAYSSGLEKLELTWASSWILMSRLC